MSEKKVEVRFSCKKSMRDKIDKVYREEMYDSRSDFLCDIVKLYLEECSLYKKLGEKSYIDECVNFYNDYKKEI